MVILTTILNRPTYIIVIELDISMLEFFWDNQYFNIYNNSFVGLWSDEVFDEVFSLVVCNVCAKSVIIYALCHFISYKY